jgi:23S rRNA (uracil1939-C5)-methyltransferase
MNAILRDAPTFAPPARIDARQAGTIAVRPDAAVAPLVMDPVVITALDQEGRGIARVDGKATFIEGALIGERVDIEVTRRKPTFDQARVTRIEAASASRVVPRCRYFGVCGGCSLQHIDHAAQVAVKQRVLEDALWHIGRLRAQQLLAPLYGVAWGYRQRARLSVRRVPKKGGVLVGFHEKKSSYVADMSSCEVLPERISALIPELRLLIERLSVRERLPQIELASAEGEDGPVDVLLLRILAPLTADDQRELAVFARLHRIDFWLQPGGPASMHPFGEAASRLAYALPDFDLRFEFDPGDFTQVNAEMNRVLVRRAIALLDPQPGERIADFFCGLGNFTLPIASRGADVIGVEGNAALVSRAATNAVRNGPDRRAFDVVSASGKHCFRGVSLCFGVGAAADTAARVRRRDLSAQARERASVERCSSSRSGGRRAPATSSPSAGWPIGFANGCMATRPTSTSIATLIRRTSVWRRAGCVPSDARKILRALTQWRWKKPSRQPPLDTRRQ